MAPFAKSAEIVEAMRFGGRQHETWPVFCAWCIDHGVSLNIDKVTEGDEDDGTGVEREVVAVGYREHVKEGEFVVIGRYGITEILDAGDFMSAYVHAEPWTEDERPFVPAFRMAKVQD